MRRENDHVHPVLVEVICRPHPQKEAGGQEGQADDESGCGTEAWKTNDLVDASAKERERESDGNDEILWSTLFRRDFNIAYLMPRDRGSIR